MSNRSHHVAGVSWSNRRQGRLLRFLIHDKQHVSRIWLLLIWISILTVDPRNLSIGVQFIKASAGASHSPPAPGFTRVENGVEGVYPCTLVCVISVLCLYVMRL